MNKNDRVPVEARLPQQRYHSPVLFDAIRPGPPLAEEAAPANAVPDQEELIKPTFCAQENAAGDGGLPEPSSASLQKIRSSLHTDLAIRSPNPQPQPAAVEVSGEKRLNAYSITQELLMHLPMCLVGGGLYVYNGAIYRLVTVEVMNRLIMHHCRRYVQAAGNFSIIKQVYELIRSEPHISNDCLKPANWIVALENGLLDLNSRNRLDFSPNVFVTSQVKGSFAFGEQMDCPHFSHYLEVVTGSDEMLKQRIWEMLGYCLVPDVSGKVFFLLQGVPDSGKSLLGEFLASCFDEDMVTSLDFSALGQQFGPSELVGKQLCLSMDLAAVPWDAKAIGQLKSLTGNDLVSADIKYQPRIRFRNTATFLFGTNHVVTTTVRDDAFFRRMVVIPFQFSVPKSRQDRHLLQRFQAEKDAIITKAINAYLFLRENNYVFSGNYDVNAVVSQAPVAGIVDQDLAVAEFFYQNCSLEEESLTFVDELHQAFVARFPSLLDLTTFSTKFYGFLERTYPGRVCKSRKRRGGSGNPLSALMGIRLV